MLQSLMMHITSTILIGPNYKVLVLMWTCGGVCFFSVVYVPICVIAGCFPSKEMWCSITVHLSVASVFQLIFVCGRENYFRYFQFSRAKEIRFTSMFSPKVHTHNQCGRNMQVCGFLAFDVMVSEVCKDCSRFSTVYARASRSRCLMGIHFSRC